MPYRSVRPARWPRGSALIKLALSRVVTMFSGVQFLPTHCRACGVVTLSPRSSSPEPAAACAACGKDASVVPGPSFGEHERPLFDWLVGVGRRAHLRPAEAQRLCFDIETDMARADQAGGFERLCLRFGELKALAPQLEGSSARLARALRMLETIFNALSIPARSMSLPAMPAVQRRDAH